MIVYQLAEFIPVNDNSRVLTIFPVFTQDACACQCYANRWCITANFNQKNQNCTLYYAQLEEGNVKIILDNSSNVLRFSNRTSDLIFTGNVLINGDAESGPCAPYGNVSSPISWSYNGPITQIYYTNVDFGGQTPTSPGPSDRGQCHFYGQISSVTQMWQTGNITHFVDPILIDNQIIWFDFSAWIGGYWDQKDYAQVSLMFFDRTNQTVGNTTILGPVLDTDRNYITSLLFRQANGLVPVGTRFFKVLVTMTRIAGGNNNGDVDNIVLIFHE
ncbi:unnamed protein product [Adineta steineri]|uniref:Apple domain-containing protein n=1 Tax=Adineta steineri TaxID=433720 RepID=A0A815X308_9BILA|nr:unnamed protein product [Adineta steineri]CAF1551507.1 unnamed protein product [Adineta steineri]